MIAKLDNRLKDRDMGIELRPAAKKLLSESLGVPVEAIEIVVRAWDSAAGTQPEDPAGSWNPKGYANNSWGRVRVHARP